MDAGPLIERILNDEGLTGDLPEAEAEAMNRWLIAKAESLAKSARTPAEANSQLEAVCRQARGVGQVMAAWLAKGDPAGVAKTLGLAWKPGKTPAETLAGLLAQLTGHAGK